jgi:hypothetical protein
LRRIVQLLIFIFAFTWLGLWAASSAVQDDLPTGLIWALLSLGVWWLMGSANREDQRNR